MDLKQNTGSIFRNSYKKEGDKQPEYKGKINVNGEEWEIALWLAESKDGKTKYFSAAISEPWKKDVPAAVNDYVDSKLAKQVPDGDDLPFI